MAQGGLIWLWQVAGGAAPTTPTIPTKGLWPKVIDRKGRLRKEPQEPEPETVRQTINRLLGIDQPEPQAEQQATDAIDVDRPVPVIPLTEAQRVQVIAALSAVPDETLLSYGLEAAVERAAQLVKELEQDDEEALLIMIALTM